MDQLGGVDFKKGCYVGQEVVSRMEHRSTPQPAGGSDLSDPAGRGAGNPGWRQERRTTHLRHRGRGIATVRLDRATDARAEGVPLTAGAVEVELRKPEWATFPLDWEKKVSALDAKFKS